MEVFGLRRTQSLKSLSGIHEKSWVNAVSPGWKRKSVSQLVQHYQSCSDLRSPERAEQNLELSESWVDGGWRREDSRENVVLWGSGRRSNLSRSRSMEFLPQKEATGTKALCALFESKATLQQGFSSNPRLNMTSEADNVTVRDYPLQDRRSHNTFLKNTATQKATQVGGSRAVNGLPEFHDRARRHLPEDKYSSSLTKGGTPTRQTRDRTSTSFSVRDRSTLYLSRTAATDTTGGPTQPEFIGTLGKRAKNSKFQPPAKEMCSACLTPVYPMEKMVANKLILHYNCFCCKHCKKKLSTHNYSSLYGEFYCISHYNQLFKRKGNYDEGFGHKQHKDRWLDKNKGTDEPDAKPTPKVSKNKLNISNGHREASAEAFATKSPLRASGDKSVADVKGKLKMSWPPEKKKNSPRQTYEPAVKNKMSDISRAGTVSMSFSEHWKSDRLSNREGMRDKWGKEQSTTAGFISAEKLPSEKTKPVSPVQANRSQVCVTTSLTHSEKRISAMTQKTVHTNVAPTSKANHSPVADRLDTSPNKARKSVRFSPNIDVARYDRTSQLSSGTENEMVADQSEEINKTKDGTDVSENAILDDLASETSEGNRKSEVYLEIPEYKHRDERANMSNQECDAIVGNSLETPQNDVATLNGGVQKVNESLDTQSLTEAFTSTQDIMAQKEPSEKLDVSPGNPVTEHESENPDTAQSPAGPVNGEEVSLEKSKNQLEKAHVTSGQEEGGDQKKPVGRTNSLKGSDKQAEKTKGKLGSWSKGKSPLSKLFTSSGNDKTNKAEQKDARKADVKPSSGLLGRLLQSSSEKAEDITKSAAQDKRREETHVDDKKTENEKGSVTKDAQKEEDPSKVPPQEQALQSDITKRLQSSEPDALNNDCRSSEPSSLSMISSETGDDLTSIAQTDAIPTDDQESHLQSSEATNLPLSDLEIESKDLDPAAQLPSTPSTEQSNSELIPEKGDDSLNDVFGDSVTSPFADPLATEIKTDESAQQLNKHDPPVEGGGNLSSGMLFDLSHNGAQDSSDFFGLSDTPSTFSASMTDTAWLEPASTQSSSLVDSGPISSENEAIIGMSDQLTIPDSTPISQDVSQLLDPLGSEKQTSEQDFDIFSSNDDLFSQPPPVNVLDHGGTAFPDDIFGSSNVSNSADVFTGLPSGQAAQSSLNDLLGSEASSVVAPSAQMDLFADDIFGSEAQLLPMSEPGGANVLADSLLASEENNTEQKSENSSWMDDLLG
uniref:LIM zinc-binding domain-containing protein n=1 Tax=Oreochromis niloticus TaxID=8128 RepID=A0A669B3P0_ORENI